MSDRDALTAANAAFERRYPGEPRSWQPLHTYYAGAHLFDAEATQRLGDMALDHLAAHAPDPFTFATAIGLATDADLPQPADRAAVAAEFDRNPEAVRQGRPATWLALTVHHRVRAKLAHEAIEDYRIDFEDGLGACSDDGEDAIAARAAIELGRALREGLAPPSYGIRIKSLGERTRARGLRTLETFVAGLLAATGGKLPDGFVTTLPKVTVPQQLATLIRGFETLERRHALAPGALRLEFMVEVTQALIGADGRCPLPALLDACEGRCVGVHLGTYDFTASCGIAAAHQAMDHPMCDLARGLMRLAYSGAGVFLSDGSTNVLPVEPHPGDAQALSASQRADNLRAVHAAWRLSYRHIRHSLRSGYYQGWDLHPGQIPVRYAACFAFFLEGFHSAAARLAGLLANAGGDGSVLDDAATGTALLDYVCRAFRCGAVSRAEVEATGLDPSALCGS